MSAGDLLFGRACRVTCWTSAPPSTGFTAQHPQFFSAPPKNALVVTGLRVRFKIEKSIEKSPNKATVTITNCAPDSRAFLQSKPMTVMLEAGYDGLLKHVFIGDVRFGSSDVVDGDWETQIELADGDRAYRNAAVSRSYPKGATVIAVLKDAAAAIGVPLPVDVLNDPTLRTQFPTGRTATGFARDELTRLLEPYGYHWSIQDGRLVVLKDQSEAPGTAFVIDQSAGMIGSPEFSAPDKAGQPPTLKIKTLLYPELFPGALFQLSSLRINGFFRANKVDHDGDTHGDEWTTEVEASPSPNTRAAS